MTDAPELIAREIDFLTNRICDWARDYMDDESMNDWNGHVAPSLARITAMVADLAPRWYRIDDPQNPPPRNGTQIDLFNEISGFRFPNSYWEEWGKDEIGITVFGWYSAGAGYVERYGRPTHWSPIRLPTGDE